MPNARDFGLFKSTPIISAKLNDIAEISAPESIRPVVFNCPSAINLIGIEGTFTNEPSGRFVLLYLNVRVIKNHRLPVRNPGDERNLFRILFLCLSNDLLHVSPMSDNLLSANSNPLPDEPIYIGFHEKLIVLIHTTMQENQTYKSFPKKPGKNTNLLLCSASF